VPGVHAAELAAHFEGMPPRYWEHVTAADLRWALQLVHRFQARGPAAGHALLEWRDLPGARGTRVLLCTRDRPGLLAKAAASLSAAGLSIREASVFTRADRTVLDLFAVANADQPGPASPARLEQAAFLLEGALAEPPRFASIWACTRHKYLAPPPRLPPRLRFETTPAAHTVLHLETSDRMGLLYDVLQAIAETGLGVLQASIETDGDVARDTFHLTDADGGAVTDPGRLAALRQAIESAIGLHL
jgi:[protein-PII] uridylyltransferase